MKITRDNFSQEMVNYRARHNLSRPDLAKKIHVSVNAIYLWENEKRDPRVTAISKLQQLIDEEN